MFEDELRPRGSLMEDLIVIQRTGVAGINLRD